MVTTRKDSKDFWKMVEKLEETSIETWKFRNEKLHAQNEKQATEIQELRVDNKKLAPSPTIPDPNAISPCANGEGPDAQGSLILLPLWVVLIA